MNTPAEELEALSAQFTEDDYDLLEDRLRLRAAVLGWTGDPLRQPMDSVLAEARSIIAQRKKK